LPIADQLIAELRNRWASNFSPTGAGIPSAMVQRIHRSVAGAWPWHPCGTFVPSALWFSIGESPSGWPRSVTSPRTTH